MITEETLRGGAKQLQEFQVKPIEVYVFCLGSRSFMVPVDENMCPVEIVPCKFPLDENHPSIKRNGPYVIKTKYVKEKVK